MAPSWTRYLLFAAPLYVLVASSPAPKPKPPPPPHPPPAALCESPACVHAASDILYTLDPDYTNIDPCTDFDQYVCGGWDQRNFLDAGKQYKSRSGAVGNLILYHLRDILELTEPPTPEDAGNFQKLKTAYNACMDEAAIRDLGPKPLNDLLGKLEQIYPVGSGQEVAANLTDAMVFLMEAEVGALIDSSIGVRSYPIGMDLI